MWLVQIQNKQLIGEPIIAVAVWNVGSEAAAIARGWEMAEALLRADPAIHARLNVIAKPFEVERWYRASTIFK